MDVKDFYYDLPQELIAQDPLEDRSSSRLMVLDKATGEVEHRHFKDIVRQRSRFFCSREKKTMSGRPWSNREKNARSEPESISARDF